ncbi:MAG TPA: cytidine deaminase [Candidatus Avilachnospira avistercoris]|nr:cytidine deaminase [Candidatus Avilachnospira avistercoris]
MTDYGKLLKMAIEKLPDSYVPYSHFHCSAALLCSDGTIFQGVNIENAAYTPTICAERCAIFKAVSEGYRDFKAIAVVGCDEKVLESNEFKNHKVLPEGYGKSGPCGVCRQVMQEFCDPETFDIILGRAEDDITVYKLKELFPHAFGPADLA